MIAGASTDPLPNKKGLLSAYFGNLGTVILSGAPVRARRNSNKSAFSSVVSPKVLISGLRSGLLRPLIEKVDDLLQGLEYTVVHIGSRFYVKWVS
jgi:hypothetical protein